MPTEQPMPANFEMSVSELEALVEQLERGELTLEEALAKFERGIALVRNCQTALQQAEQKVQTLIEKDGRVEITEFEPEG